ncbi:hypothetical protein TPHA_0A00770 [Tetrapisispora phaffii CBS 4417]|uniref:DUF221 domain-containing protein n=1 Tax=Tetrapisispora phaffii (strain ATCC 24235 / CBS 4417 / NBRC 1672 / NRRL Y-8282 / UCD 70-5) TaxID=1071381 RepID=G8BMN4_TETPH|nr:hypothetical protein TPHA_0A00770 [Tetrapisispora phaffii CBS 4417]CCE61162.1 hypothetical protein TPHA_0A00770 [Tetrapisispora phaffii CBS 4417]
MPASSSSTSAFVTSLIFNGIIALIFIILFINLRPKFTRVYEPRSLKDIYTIKEEERTEPAPYGYFKWVPFLLTKRHSYLIQNASVDGYFFLRYLAIILLISFLSFFVLFPILLPVNATNGRDYKGFELLSMSNVTNKNRFYAHVFLSWIWFSIIIYIIYRELYYYVVFRHALQTSPLYDGLLSSRTIILTDLNPSKNSELERIFTKANKISVAKNVKELEKLCKERKSDTQRYESALNKMIKQSMKKKLKADKNKKYHDKLYENDRRLVNDLETYVPYEKRPKHYIGSKLPSFLKMINGKKVNTVSYLNEHIPEENEQIFTKQQEYEHSREYLRTVFIQFDTQLEAQKVYQTLDYLLGRENYAKKYIGYSPEQIVWSNLNMTTRERSWKRCLATTFLVLMIIFWAIPVAVVGMISNISFLTTKIFFLEFINNLPNFLLGLITGILPSVALSILMSLVPPVIMYVGKLRGLTTLKHIDLYCHSWYFAFQVIETFIVTTGTSSASSTVTAIIDDPSQAMTLLSNNLPKASNFYISYFLLLGLTVPTGMLLQIITLVMSKIKGMLFTSTPRQKWTSYNTLATPSMGILYPTIEIIMVILISYSIIAPLVLVFSTLALFLLYLAYVYNLNFVMGFSLDSKGRNYPKGLFHIFVGIYMSEVCLIGLFVMLKSWGCVVLEAFYLGITALLHIWFKRKFIPLFDIVPLSAIYLSRGLPNYQYPNEDLGTKEVHDLRERVKQALESDETGGVLRLATDHELKVANILKTEERNPDESSPSSGENTLSESNPSSILNGGEKKIIETEHLENANGSSDIDVDNRRNNNTDLPAHDGSEVEDKDASSKTGTTFVKGDETFRKLHYEDLEGLERPVLGNQGGEKHKSTVMHNTDVGIVYTDKTAMTRELEALPENINRSFTWKQRLKNFFHPSQAYKFETMRKRLPHVFNTTIAYSNKFISQAYINPCVSDENPKIWICKDTMGVSQQQIEEANNYNLYVTDAFTSFDKKGRAQFTFNPPDFLFEGKK